MVHLGIKGHLHDCVTEINDGDNTDGDRKKISSDMFEAHVTFTNIVQAHAPSILRDYGIDWVEKDLSMSEVLEGNHPEGYRRCRLANSLAYRVNGTWALSAIFANESKDVVVMPFKRGFFQEAVSLNKLDEVVPFTFTLPTCNTVQEEPRKMNLTGYKSGTAREASWGGRTTWMHFGSRELWQNSALEAALLHGQHEKDLVEDSEAASNLAILMLPARLLLFLWGFSKTFRSW